MIPKNPDGLYCLVRDSDERHYSLPGGGCDLGETAQECSARETMEEAQIENYATKILGVYLLSYRNKDGQILHQVQHVRTSSTIKAISEFIPQKNGFETDERLFVPKSELIDYIDWLKYDGSNYFLNQIDKI